MKPRTVRVFASWRALDPDDAKGRDVVVVDTLRATTTIAFALAGGASVRPVAGVNEARREAKNLGRRALLAGERKGLPIAGFDLGNSPRELVSANLDGRILVLTTTNGTQAVERCAQARRIYAAALVNAPAVAGFLAQAPERELAVVCAGRGDGGIAIEDVAGAGALVYALSRKIELRLMDGARLARELFERHRKNLGLLLRESDGGRYLKEIGAGGDLPFCAQHGTLAIVPILRHGVFVDANQGKR